MHALKGIVVFMGLIIITLMVLIVYGMIQKAQNPDFSFFGKKETPAISGGFNNINLGLPTGSTIIGSDVGENNISIRVDTDGTNGADTIIIMDIKSGNIVGRIGVGP